MWLRQLVYGLFLAVIVALPSAIALAYFKITGDPSFRPLAQTLESVVFGGTVGETRDMKVQLRLHDPAPERATRMARVLQRSFSAKGIEAQVFVIGISPAEPAGVTYIVGRNRIGPYPLSRASEGINAAVSAYQVRVRGE